MTAELTKAFNAFMDPLVSAAESLSWIGTSTYVLKVPALDAQIQPLADGLGMELSLIKYTISLFLAYPLAVILRLIPGKNLKHLFSFVGGVFLAQWIFGPDWIHTFASSAGTYLICMLAPRKQVATIVFVWAMAYMTAAHIYRMYVSYMSGIFDFTGMQMVLTMKLTSFAYNLYDGTVDREKVFPKTPHEDKGAKKVYESRARFAIDKLPNPLEFFGYIYCFTCLLAGPAFEYADYARSIDGSVFQRPVDKKSAESKLPSRSPPRSEFYALTCLLIGVVSLVGHLQLVPTFPVRNLTKPGFVPAFGEGHGWRFLYTYIALFTDRLKYYFAWKIAEGASVMGGFGFEGYNPDGSPKGWRGVENIDIWAFETSTNVQTLSRAWNKRTQGWLERYTYHRTGKSLLMTYFISALWHGLYPGFFLFFLTVPLVTNIERLIKAKINPLIVPGYDGFDNKTYPRGVVGQVYWLVCWVCNTICMNYVVQVFSMQSWDNCMVALGAYHHVPHAALFLIYLVMEYVVPKPKNKSKAVKSD